MEPQVHSGFTLHLIRARKWFHAELRKLAGCDFACVVVEASLRDALEGTGHWRPEGHELLDLSQEVAS